ncbi:MAG: BspA family leucine-rich repeat surface protein, partial [Anaerovoracaceae bacterium]
MNRKSNVIIDIAVFILAFVFTAACIGLSPFDAEKSYADGELQGKAYAVWLDKDQTVNGVEYKYGTFVYIRSTDYTSGKKIKSISGGEFEGNVYRDIETKRYSKTAETPWYLDLIEQHNDPKVYRCVFIDKIKPKSTACWFSTFDLAASIEGLEKLDTSETIDMNRMFFKCNALTSIDTSHLDTSKVTNMSSMFFGCGNLTSLDVSKFDTSKVQDMRYMFS